MELLFYLLSLLGILLASLGITFLLNCYMKKRGFTVYCTINYLIVIIVSTALYIFGGISIWTIKGVIMLLILLCASVQDISTHEADDSLWIMLFVLSFVNIEETLMWSMVLSGAIVFVPQIVIVILSKGNSIGGADIKLSTAAAFSLGLYKGIIGFMIGLVIAIAFQLIYNKIKKQSFNKAFALIPFIGTGFMFSYFI